MKIPKHYYSWTTLIGAVIAIISFSLIVFLFIISLFTKEGNQYSGLIMYIILPVFLVLGLIMIPLGMIFKRRKEKREEIDREHRFPIVNLNDPKQRWVVIFVIITTTVLLVMSALGSYEAFHYTESNEFCGTLCHKVMNPEYVTYHSSAHARVKCVECHVGSGATWYVKSKLSGLYQVYSYLFNKYPRPIPTPIHNLRPARETCEQCHWPQKFYDRKYVVRKHYIADEENSEWDIHLLMKTSPEYKALGLQEGIHWHISPDVKIEYATVNSKRDTIVWVKYTNLKSGKESIFRDDSIPVTRAQLDTLHFRTMDCLDCHNRPSHKFKSPIEFFDDAMTAGRLPKDMPDLKIAAMDILDEDYPSLDSAFSAINTGINEYYEFMYEDIYDTAKDEINHVVSEIEKDYSENVFPYMKTKWNTHLNHLGHLESNGCYRCHNNRFKSQDGKVISRECTLCHYIKAQGPPDNMEYANGKVALDFVHPVDIKGKWKRIFCSECHDNLYE